MKELELTKATAPLAAYANNARREPLILTRRGKPVAALLPVEGADRETITLSLNPDFIALIQRSRARHKSEGGISPAKMRRRFAPARARRRK